MKATQRDFAATAPRAAQQCKVFFFCGQDEAGAAAAAQRIAAMLPDAEERVELSGADVRKDPVLLGDEARSGSLFGNARYIQVRANGDEAHDAIALLLEAIDAGQGEPCPVLVVASSATDKSRTAKLLEKRADARQLGKAFGDPATIWRFGWASALARSTCFSATNRGHWGCKLANGEDYVGARKADVLASVTEAPAGRECQWLVNGVVAATTPCGTAQIRLADIPIGTAFTLAVKADGSALAEAPDQTIRPVTILGMGDSFASGEGNPEVYVGNAQARQLRRLTNNQSVEASPTFSSSKMLGY